MHLHHRGFTLIELAVALALIGVAMSLAVSSWQRLNDRHRLTGGARQAAAFLTTVQSDAIERNDSLSVAFTRTSPTQWCLGAATGPDGCDCTESDPAQADYCAVDGAPRRLVDIDGNRFQLLSIADWQPAGGDGRIVFDPVVGILDPPGDELELAFASRSDDYRLTVRLGPTGLIEICQPADSDIVPGYPECTR